MKAIINCSRPRIGWTENFFENINPYMLPILGKPLIEFYLDYCCLSGIKNVLIVYDDFSDELADFVSNGSRWGLNISTAPIASDSSRSDIMLHYAKFANEELIYIDKFFFPFYDKNAPKKSLPSDKNEHIVLAGNSKHSDIFCACEEIEIPTLLDYYELNMRLLKSSQNTSRLTMKGYSAQSGVFMGMNDAIMRGTNLQPPFIVGNNAQIEMGVQLGKNAIIGDTCIIDKHSKIQDSIIFDKTYIGADLDLRGKILTGNNIIDPVAKVKVSFSDNYFTSKVSGGSAQNSLKRLFELGLTSVIIIAMTPAQLLFLALGRPPHTNFPIAQNSEKKKRVFCPFFKHENTTKNAWFFKLSLDKYPKLWKVLKGEMRLIGDTPRNIINDEDLLKRHKTYRCGTFTYADSLGHDDPYESLIDDLFYKHNRSLKSDMQLLLRALVSRLLKGYKSDEV